MRREHSAGARFCSAKASGREASAHPKAAFAVLAERHGGPVRVRPRGERAADLVSSNEPPI